MTDACTRPPASRRRWWRHLTWPLPLVVVAVGTGAWGHAGYGHLTLVLPVALGLSGAAAVACAMSLVEATRSTTEGKSTTRLVFVLTALASATAWGSIVAGLQFHKLYLRSAKAWCEAQVPSIEAYRATHGHFPESLRELCPDDSVPWVVQTFDTSLISREDWFVFDLGTGLFSGWSYSSNSRTWARYH